MKRVTTIKRAPRKVTVIKPAYRVVVAPIIAAEWVPLSRAKPPRDAWIVYMTKDGYADIAHEWRDEQHGENATHWLRGYPGGKGADGIGALIEP